VAAADGSFDYRRNIATAPAFVCVASPIVRDASGTVIGGGGVDDLVVTRK
jgi:hypothetical protein